jgi:hypothetical protein
MPETYRGTKSTDYGSPTPAIDLLALASERRGPEPQRGIGIIQSDRSAQIFGDVANMSLPFDDLQGLVHRGSGAVAIHTAGPHISIIDLGSAP